MIWLETERLILRPYSMDDLNALHEALDLHPDVWRFDPGYERTKDERAELLRYRILQHERNEFGECAVVRKQDRRLIGYCGLQLYVWEHAPLSTPEVELYYKLARDCWREGYATEACRAMIEHAFTKLKLHRIVTWTARENVRSVALLKRLGMTIRDDPSDPNGVFGILENDRGEGES